MRTLSLLFSSLLLTVPALHGVLAAAEPDSHSECEIQAGKYGDGTGRSRIPGSCFDDYYSLANPAAKRSSPDGLIHAFGHGGILYSIIKDPSQGRETRNIIAGGQTGLSRIAAIAIDERHQELFVLDQNPKSGAILVFPASFSGNLAPIRRIPLKNAEKATALHVHPERGEIVVSFADQGLTVFRIQADIDGRRPENEVTPLAKLPVNTQKITSIQDLCIDETKPEILALDPDKKRVAVLSRDSGQLLRSVEANNTEITANSALQCGAKDAKAAVISHGSRPGIRPSITLPL
jgi:hypothetical protein